MNPSASSPGSLSNRAAMDIDWQTAQKPCNHAVDLAPQRQRTLYEVPILPLYAAEPAPVVHSTYQVPTRS